MKIKFTTKKKKKIKFTTKGHFTSSVDILPSTLEEEKLMTY